MTPSMTVLVLCGWLFLASVMALDFIDIISTIAGTGSASYSGDGGAATSAAIYGPSGVAVDSSGNVYICEYNGSRIRKFTVSTGIISSVAGKGTYGFSGDGAAATSAAFNYPKAVAVDSSGNVYVADSMNSRIRKVTASTGIISTIAGTGTSSFSGDNGAATSATMYCPWGVAVDLSGNVYIADTYNHRIRKVTVSTGIIVTIAGTGTGLPSGDNGPATSAALYYPQALTLDSSDNVYIADTTYPRIRKVAASTGIITTIAGTGLTGFSGDDGPATSATFFLPNGVAVDSSGNVYIADTSNQRIRKVTASTGIITTIAGNGTVDSSGDGGEATSAALSSPLGVAVNSAGNLFIADSGNNRIRKITATVAPSIPPTTAPTYYPSLSPHSIRVINTIAGTGTNGYSGDGGQATSEMIAAPSGIDVDSSGNVYFSEFTNNRVRKITVATGIISTYVGTGSGSYSGDGGVASSATIYGPNGLCIDTSDNLYVSDLYNHRIRKVTASTSIISTIAGTGVASYSGDGGLATSAALSSPVGVAVDTSGNLYISELGNHRIRKVTASTSVITTIAGTGIEGYSGDGGPATSAKIKNPQGVNLDSSLNVYIGDFSGYNVIRKITVSTGIIGTVVGTGSTSGGFNGDNIQATAATLNNPVDVVFDSFGNIYICDMYNYRIRKVTASTNVISTVIGTGSSSSAGDGSSASSAAINAPCFARFDGAGNYYISECGGFRVRKVTTVSTDIPTLAPSISPSITATSRAPTIRPSTIPSVVPSRQPSYIPSMTPSTAPSAVPSTLQPSYIPSMIPSTAPSAVPSTLQPSYTPSMIPSTAPSAVPSTLQPSYTPSMIPSTAPSVAPSTLQPSCIPTMIPTATPSAVPSTPQPSYTPSMIPSTSNPTVQPTEKPTLFPTVPPTSYPSSRPSGEPTIIPTSSTPSTVPTSAPTSTPTVTNLVLANFLTTSLTAEVVREKTKYYLGIYVVYFLSWYVLLYIFGYCRIGKDRANELYRVSHKMGKYKICAKQTDNGSINTAGRILGVIYSNNRRLKDVLKMDEEIRLIKIEKEFTNAAGGFDGDPFDDPFSVDEETPGPKSAVKSGRKASINSKLNNLILKHEDAYSRGFREYMKQKRCLIGCTPVLCPNGLDVNLLFARITLPPGRFEDFVLYLCNNHPFFNNFYYMSGSRLGVHGTKLTYIGKDVAVFVLSLMASMIVNYYGISSSFTVDMLVNMFIITPLSIVIGLLLVYVYTCPCTESVAFQRNYSRLQGYLLCLGRAVAIPILVIIGFSLILACLFSNKSSIFYIVLNYLWNVQLFGILYEIVMAIWAYVDSYHLNIDVCGICLVSIGNLYCESIVYDGLVKDRDFFVRVWNYWVIRVEMILNREDALRRGWMKKVECVTEMATTNPVLSGAAHANEAGSIEVDDTKEGSISVVYNPDLDDVFDASSHGTCNDDRRIADDAHVLVSYSVYDVGKEAGTSSLYSGLQVHGTERVVNPLSAMRSAIATSGLTADDESALYQEYQNEMNEGIRLSSADGKNDGVEYDFTEETLTFEEWKVKKREFKKGTRGSFVRAFQVFEEKEQLSSPSSVQNAMRLGNYATKVNPLAKRK